MRCNRLYKYKRYGSKTYGIKNSIKAKKISIGTKRLEDFSKINQVANLIKIDNYSLQKFMKAFLYLFSLLRPNTMICFELIDVSYFIIHKLSLLLKDLAWA